MDGQGGFVQHPAAVSIEAGKVGAGVAAMAVQEEAQPTCVGCLVVQCV